MQRRLFEIAKISIFTAAVTARYNHYSIIKHNKTTAA